MLVNDFGAINIDAALIASADSDTIALTNGCVCCSIGDDLSQALIRVLDASEPFDGIVIEASGVSDPWRIAQIGLAEPALSLDGVIVLLDAQALADNLANPLLRDSIERPLAHADLVVLAGFELLESLESLLHAVIKRRIPKMIVFPKTEMVFILNRFMINYITKLHQIGNCFNTKKCVFLKCHSRKLRLKLRYFN